MQIRSINYTTNSLEGGVTFRLPFDLESSRITRADVLLDNGRHETLEFADRAISLADLQRLLAWKDVLIERKKDVSNQSQNK